MTSELDTELLADAQGKPVAWMYTSRYGKEVCKFRYARDEGRTPDDWLGWTETPLYTHPPAQDVAALAVAAKWCADDLESEIRSRWIEPDTGLPHPANQHRYDRDMETVREVRTALAKHERTERDA